jgi:hypothetical protein
LPQTPDSKGASTLHPRETGKRDAVRNAILRRGSHLPVTLANRRLKRARQRIARHPAGQMPLGLFGYSPEKKIVRPAATADPLLQEAIRGELQAARRWPAERLGSGERFRLPRYVSAACETLGIKVKPCQPLAPLEKGTGPMIKH